MLLTMDRWLSETCRAKHWKIKIICKNMCISLVYLHIAIRCPVHTTSKTHSNFLISSLHEPQADKTVFFSWLDSPSRPRPPLSGFSITLTIARNPLDEGLARRRDLYRTTQKIHKRDTSMPLARFELLIPTREWPQADAIGRAATGIGRQSK